MPRSANPPSRMARWGGLCIQARKTLIALFSTPMASPSDHALAFFMYPVRLTRLTRSASPGHWCAKQLSSTILLLWRPAARLSFLLESSSCMPCLDRA